MAEGLAVAVAVAEESIRGGNPSAIVVQMNMICVTGTYFYIPSLFTLLILYENIISA